jgi:hypothetical protein
MADFKPEIKKILDKHREQLPSEPSRIHGEVFDKDIEEWQREFDLMNRYLIDFRDSIDEDNVEELKQDIANKLAISSLDRVGQKEWWWKPANGLVTDTLEEVQRTLEKMTAGNARKWPRKLQLARKVLAELIYLAIVVGLFFVASSDFETVVLAALVLIYNSLVFVTAGVGMGVVYLTHNLEAVYGELGRTLRLKVPISRTEEGKKLIEDLTVPNLIHYVSIGIGSIIALWHLVTAILRHL